MALPNMTNPAALAEQTTQQVKEGVAMAQKFYETAADFLVRYGFQVLGGLLILAIGAKIAAWVSGLFVKFLEKRHVDTVLAHFLGMVVKVLIITFVAIASLEKFGVTISPLIASVSALIFGASFAIQAPLSNYAAGLMIILTHPFTVGDTIAIDKVSGVVEEVKLPTTILSTGDGERINVPNKEIVGQILWNSHHVKVVELEFGISYGDDPEKAIELAKRTLATFPQVSQKPAPQVGLSSFGESSVNIGLRYWVPTREYNPTRYAVNLALFKAVRNAGLTMPFPQRELRILPSPSATAVLK